MQKKVNNIKSVYEFDDLVTAPAFGYKSADDYYNHGNGNLCLENVRVPLLLISAKTDPVCSIRGLDKEVVRNNENEYILIFIIFR